MERRQTLKTLHGAACGGRWQISGTLCPTLTNTNDQLGNTLATRRSCHVNHSTLSALTVLSRWLTGSILFKRLRCSAIVVFPRVLLFRDCHVATIISPRDHRAATILCSPAFRTHRHSYLGAANNGPQHAPVTTVTSYSKPLHAIKTIIEVPITRRKHPKNQNKQTISSNKGTIASHSLLPCLSK